MSYTFRALLIPPAQEPIATLICDELGYPEKGMFITTMREDGTPPPLGQPDPRPIQGYISTGSIPDDSPLLQDAAGLYDEIVKRNPDTKVTLAQCTEFVNWLDLTDVDPYTRQEFMKAEIAGDPEVVPTAPKSAQGKKVADKQFNAKLIKESEDDVPEGYPMNAVEVHLGTNWRNLVDNNLEPPAVGKSSWRRLWDKPV